MSTAHSKIYRDCAQLFSFHLGKVARAANSFPVYHAATRNARRRRCVRIGTLCRWEWSDGNRPVQTYLPHPASVPVPRLRLIRRECAWEGDERAKSIVLLTEVLCEVSEKAARCLRSRDDEKVSRGKSNRQINVSLWDESRSVSNRSVLSSDCLESRADSRVNRCGRSTEHVPPPVLILTNPLIRGSSSDVVHDASSALLAFEIRICPPWWTCRRDNETKRLIAKSQTTSAGEDLCYVSSTCSSWFGHLCDSVFSNPISMGRFETGSTQNKIFSRVALRPPPKVDERPDYLLTWRVNLDRPNCDQV